MFIVYLILTFGILIKTISYGIYEYKQMENKVGGILVISLAIFAFVFSNVLFYCY